MSDDLTDQAADDGFDGFDDLDDLGGSGEPDDAEGHGESGLSEWHLPQPTGVQAVDDAVAEIAELDGLPTAEHVAYYESAHRHLQDALADFDSA